MTDGKQYASEADLGDDNEWEDVQLPQLGVWAHVRYLTTPEIARMSNLPDLAGWTEAIKSLVRDGADAKDPFEEARYAEENYRYRAHIAHLAVLKDPTRLDDVECESCGFEHPASMWPLRKTMHLHTSDLNVIANVAFRLQSVKALRPLSTAETESASAEPAVTGT